MNFGLRCSQPACRPHPASLPVSCSCGRGFATRFFSFASRLRLAFRYRYLHRFRLAPFIQQDSAHAGHTGAGGFACQIGHVRPFSASSFSSVLSLSLKASTRRASWQPSAVWDAGTQRLLLRRARGPGLDSGNHWRAPCAQTRPSHKLQAATAREKIGSDSTNTLKEALCR